MDRLPRLVDTADELDAMAAVLRDAPLIAVDTESNAFHAYRPRVSLIQVANREREWAVDPRALDDLAPIRRLLDDSRAVKVIHAAEGDILGLRRDFGFGIGPVFDTMLAARILGYRHFGLADLLAEHFGVRLDKRYQRHDWGQRPIPPAALRYAGGDVHYLPALHDLLRQNLIAAGRLEEAQEEFARISRVQPEERAFDPEGFWRVRGARELAPAERAALRELYQFRDSRARALDRAPVRVFGDEVLLALSRLRPADTAGLRRAGLSPLQSDRFGGGIVAAIERAAHSKPPEPPRGNGAPPDPRVTARYDALRAWRKARAAERGVEPEIIVSNAVLRAVARSNARTAAEVARAADLGPWKANTYAEELLNVLRSVP